MTRLANAIAVFTNNFDQFEAMGLEWIYKAIEPGETEAEIQELAELMQVLQETKADAVERKDRLGAMAATFAIIGIGACLNKVIESEVGSD